MYSVRAFLYHCRCRLWLQWAQWSLWFLCGIGPGAAWAQTAPVPTAPGPTIIPPSPTAASLGRFGVIPVSHATGVANVSIPLWEARGNNLSLPLSLDYHYTGLRLNEPSSWTGMGWALSAGGAITRSVRGRIDIPGEFSSYENIAEPLAKAQDQDLLHAAAGGVYDTEPDVYYFNFAGHSGKFFLSHDSVFISPYQLMTVSPSSQGFVVTDDDGTRYEFFAQELTKPNHNSQGGTGPHVAAWYLSRIVSPVDGEEIRLTYDTVPISQPSYLASSTLTEYLPSSEMGRDRCGQNSVADFTYFGGIVNTQLVRTISTAHQTLQLQWANRRLNSIVVQAAGDATATPLRTISLWYGSFGGDPNGFQALRLDSVSLQGQGGTRQPPYVLSYHDGTFPLPQTLGLDHWGYYNGQDGNTSLFTATLNVSIPGRIGYANREPSLPHLRLGALHAIRYPTGGRTEFTYEANQRDGGAKTEDLVEHVVTRGVPHGTGALRERWATVDTVWFRITRPGPVLVTASRLLQATAGATNHNTPEALLSDATGRVWASLGAPRPPESSAPYEPEMLTNAVVPFSLPVGLYCLAVRCDVDEAQVSATVQFYDGRPPVVPYYLLPAPGLRIARIASYARSHDRHPALVKRYQYTTPAGQSTGEQFTSVGYQTRNYTEQRPAQDPNTVSGPANVATGLCQYSIHTAQTAATLDGLAQAGMFYSNVTEWSDSAGVAGKTVYDYEKRGTAGDEVFLTQQREYAYDNGTHRLVKSHQLIYAFVADRVFYTFRPTQAFKATYGTSVHPSGRNNYYEAPVTALVSTWHYPFQTIDQQYDAQGRAYTSSTTTLYHPQHRHPVRTIATLSTGQQLVSRMRYPQDFTTGPYIGTAAQGIRSLLQQHIWNPVLEQQQWRRTATDSVLVQASATLYTGITPAQQLVLKAAAPLRDFRPAAMDQNGFRYDSRYQSALTFDHYNSANHLVELHQRGGAPQAYVWGYDNTEPIATVRNAGHAQVAHTSFEEESTGGWTYPATAVNNGGVTGKQCLALASGVALEQRTVPPGAYELSFWATGRPVVTIGGQQLPLPMTASATRADGWQQFRLRCTVPTSGMAIQAPTVGSCLLDEVRLHPVGAQMTTYTYDPVVGMTSQTDLNGRITTYEYDGLGRLLRARDEQDRILVEQEYQYLRH